MGVVNIDDKYAEKFMQTTVDSLYTFGKSPSAQVRAENIVHTDLGTEFSVKMPTNTFLVKMSLFGDFNVSNVLAAVSVLASQKVDSKDIAQSIADIPEIA